MLSLLFLPVSTKLCTHAPTSDFFLHSWPLPNADWAPVKADAKHLAILTENHARHFLEFGKDIHYWACKPKGRVTNPVSNTVVMTFCTVQGCSGQLSCEAAQPLLKGLTTLRAEQNQFLIQHALGQQSILNMTVWGRVGTFKHTWSLESLLASVTLIPWHQTQCSLCTFSSVTTDMKIWKHSETVTAILPSLFVAQTPEHEAIDFIRKGGLPSSLSAAFLDPSSCASSVTNFTPPPPSPSRRLSPSGCNADL